MNRFARFILASLYAFILMILALLFVWEIVGKPYIESYIKTNYGNAINETYNNSELLKEFFDDFKRKPTDKKDE